MSKSAVIYWSGTGNTEAMAQAVLDGLNGAGEDAALFSADSVRAADAAQYDKLALGCPAMGARDGGTVVSVTCGVANAV